MRNVIWRLMVSASAMIVFPALGLAQFGSIAGVVRDNSGAVLPNVTVEAASPALIEKSRTAVSDGSGQYRVEQLRPGTYTVTFTLSGFSTFRRDGIEISENFTAPINATLNVGAVKDTIIVEAQAPVVDVQNVAEQRTLLKAELDALPTARSFATLGTTIPSVSADQYDVGGTQGERGNVLSAHGSNGFDMTLQVDGISISVMGAATASGNAWSTFSLNEAAVQEMSYETSAISAEASSGGVRVNVIPREGGNAFHGSLFGDYANRSMSMSNLTATERAQGLTVVPGFNLLYDEDFGIGGPIIKDRLWFYYAQRYRSNDIADINTYYSINPLSTTYNPDLKHPAHSGGFDGDNQMRVTTQLTPRNKVSFFFDKVNKCNCPTIVDVPVFTAESSSRLTYSPNGVWVGSVGWVASISPKLVLDTSVSYNRQDDLFVPLVPDVTAGGPISIQSIDQTGFHILRAPTPGVFTGGEYQNQANARAALSYVTGRHSVKVGVDYHYGHRSNPTYETSSDVSYLVAFGHPLSATFYSAPYVETQNVSADMGIYAQDKWTLRRLTIDYG
ncbi:MAG TPA: TonB-dependent receptor, partial [Humisphaera sp.]|nr:TonB-dependent receptor [Humisphaera sp.]